MPAFTRYDGLSAFDLAAAALAPDSGIVINPGSVVYRGASSASSYYDGSLTTLGIGSGILLTSGSGTPSLSNTSGFYTVTTGAPGDTDLTAVAKAAFPGAGTTNDATTLSFTFDITDPSVKAIAFNVVFGSEEYPEWANSSFIDIAAVFVNGENVAYFNGDASRPLSITQKNIDGGFFRNNANNSLGIEYDGVSLVLTIIAPVKQGTNTVKIGVADTGDRSLDSGVFISGIQSLKAAGSGVFQNVSGTSEQDSFDHSSTSKNYFYDLAGGNDDVKFSAGKNVASFGTGDDEGWSLGGTSENNADGGDGFDTWYYPDAYHPDLVKVTNGTVKIGLNSDYLTNFELLQFADISVKVSDLLSDGTFVGETKKGGNGADKIKGTAGRDHLQGENGNDVLEGGLAPDHLFGGAGADFLSGGQGNDWLYGGTGDDTLSGGTGADTFVFEKAGGRDTILDFAVGTDKIQLNGISFKKMEKLDVELDGVLDVVLSFSSGSAVLLGAGAAATSPDLLFI